MINILNETTLRIKDLTETPSLDAQVLLAHISGKNRSWVISHPELVLNSEQLNRLSVALEQMKSGVPLPYIIGKWEFYGLELVISKDVLIPRPETELLIDKALEWLNVNPHRHRLIDMGTGSGCIAVVLAVNVPDLLGVATDISHNALKIARQNAEKFNVVGRIELLYGNLWEAFKIKEGDSISLQTKLSSFRADLITANLPYIPTSILHGLKVYSREPVLALDGGEDGMNLIGQFLKKASLFLMPKGLILVELESSLGLTAKTLAEQHFPAAEILLHQDLSGNDRILEIRS